MDHGVWEKQWSSPWEFGISQSHKNLIVFYLWLQIWLFKILGFLKDLQAVELKQTYEQTLECYMLP